MQINKIVLCGLAASFICVLGPISIPLSVIPIPFATLIIYIIALTFDVRCSVVSVLIYVILGCIGLPVFSGFSGGVAHILGPTGGFILGYIPLAFIVSLLNNSKSGRVIGLTIGTLSLYFVGCVWFCLYTNENLVTAFKLYLLPFVLIDIIKIALSLMIYPRIKNIIR